MEVDFCVEALGHALRTGKPEIFNTDQGSQFTSRSFTELLQAEGVMISMDGRGRVYDKIFVERLWRSVTYEEMYLREYETIKEAVSSLRAYFVFYNQKRLHQPLRYKTPHQLYTSSPTPGST
jgi:putative transposase